MMCLNSLAELVLRAAPITELGNCSPTAGTAPALPNECLQLDVSWEFIGASAPQLAVRKCFHPTGSLCDPDYFRNK
jgi:hypothetical protein